MKADASLIREEKIHRLRVEKESENRLKEISLIQVIVIMILDSRNERRKA